jgi:hypothetical protein
LGVGADDAHRGDENPPGGGAVVAGHGREVELDVVGAVRPGEGHGVRELHGHEGLPAAAQRAGGLEVRAGLVDEQVEQLAVLLVLHHGVARSDNAENVGSAGGGVGAHGRVVVGDGQGGDPVRGEVGGSERNGADVPATEPRGGHDLLGGQAVAGDDAEAVPGVLAGGEESGGAVVEGLDLG